MYKLTGILIAFISPALHSWSNILDGYFSNKIFDRISHLIFFTELTNLLFIPIVFFLDKPQNISLNMFCVILLISIIEIFYQYPYYKSLREVDTSIVSSLFSLGKIFIPLFAFIFVGERLNNLQYVGFFIIIISSVFLTLDFKKFVLSKSFFLMFFVSIALSLQGVLYKYLFEYHVSWGSAVIWASLVQFMLSLFVVILPTNYKTLKKSTEKLKDNIKLFFIAQSLSYFGNIIGEYAVFLIPISLERGITSTQPIFTLLFAVIFLKKAPGLFNESIDFYSLCKKIVIFSLVIVGIVLITL